MYTLPHPWAPYPPAGGGCIPFPTRICQLLGGSRLSLQVKLLCAQTKGWGCGCLPLFSVLVHPALPAEAPPCMALGGWSGRNMPCSPQLCVVPLGRGLLPPIPPSLDAVGSHDGGGGWIWGGLLQLSFCELCVCHRGARCGIGAGSAPRWNGDTFWGCVLFLSQLAGASRQGTGSEALCILRRPPLSKPIIHQGCESNGQNCGQSLSPGFCSLLVGWNCSYSPP